MAPRVGVLLSRVRVEEKLLLAELESRGVEAKVIDDRELVLAVEHKPELGVDVVLERCIQHGTALYALSVLDTWGVPTVNRYEVAEICGNKLLTTMRLIRDGVPSPRTRVAFTPGAALAAIEELGYPVVMKPLIGSWGRLVSKVNDREAAEAIVEHKDVLGNYLHSIYYIQEYVPKPGRDIRAFVVGDAKIVAGSESLAGKPVTAAHPNLRKRTSLTSVHYEDVSRCDVLFLSLPNGSHRAHEFEDRASVLIDLSSDHRLRDAADYDRWYGSPHPRPDRLDRFVYGIPELHRREIKGATRITGAGCNATASILALLPLFRADVVDRRRRVRARRARRPRRDPLRDRQPREGRRGERHPGDERRLRLSRGSGSAIRGVTSMRGPQAR